MAPFSRLRGAQEALYNKPENITSMFLCRAHDQAQHAALRKRPQILSVRTPPGMAAFCNIALHTLASERLSTRMCTNLNLL